MQKRRGAKRPKSESVDSKGGSADLKPTLSKSKRSRKQDLNILNVIDEEELKKKVAQVLLMASLKLSCLFVDIYNLPFPCILKQKNSPY